MLRSLLTVHPLRMKPARPGLAVAERYGLSVYDAMIVAAAVHAGCHSVWSEEMHDGVVVNDVLEVTNPFRAAACE